MGLLAIMGAAGNYKPSDRYEPSGNYVLSDDCLKDAGVNYNVLKRCNKKLSCYKKEQRRIGCQYYDLKR